MKHPLPDESVLIAAEDTLTLWAEMLAEEDLDHDAAEALRVKSVILKFRCNFNESAKRP